MIPFIKKWKNNLIIDKVIFSDKNKNKTIFD